MESCEFPWTRCRSWRRIRCSLPSPSRRTELRVFRCHNEIRFPGPCQDADEGFGFQEKLEVVALLQCESSLYVYYCEFGVPCECSREITTAGQCSQAPSDAMWTRCHRAGFRPFLRMKFQTRGAASWLRKTLKELVHGWTSMASSMFQGAHDRYQMVSGYNMPFTLDGAHGGGGER